MENKPRLRITKAPKGVKVGGEYLNGQETELKNDSENVSETKKERLITEDTKQCEENTKQRTEQKIEQPKEANSEPKIFEKVRLVQEQSQNKLTHPSESIDKLEQKVKQKRIRGIKEFLTKHYPRIGLVVTGGLALFFALNIYLWYFSGSSQEKLVTKYKNVNAVTEQEVIPQKVKKVSDKYPFLDVDFTPLQKNNKEVVAWLKVGAVNIDMPITQTDNNEYYLDHDVDRKKNSLGWVFADTRSSLEYLGDNTVLYGHNLTNQQMFGSLKDLFKVDPEKVKQDEVIQFTTQTQKMVFEITSVYITDYEDWKYVQQGFKGEGTKKAFVKRMQDKNEVKAFTKKDLSEKDQFLTFSTCYGAAGTTDRLVVHARLVASTNNY